MDTISKLNPEIVDNRRFVLYNYDYLEQGGSFMQKKYLYNTATGKLHILGYCPASKIKPYNVKYFDTEDDALAYDERAVSMCKICMRKREQETREQK